MKKILNKEGLTLIEVILATTISSIVIVAVISFFLNFINIQNDIQKKSTIITSGMNAMNIIKYNIDQTTDIKIINSEHIDKYEKKYKGYKYIYTDNKKIAISKIGSGKKTYLMEDLNYDISILFEKYNKKSGKEDDVIKIQINMIDKNTNKKLKPLIYYVYLQNIGNNSIGGINGNSIIFKEENI